MNQKTIDEALRRLSESEGGVFFGGRIYTEEDELHAAMSQALPAPPQAAPPSSPVGGDSDGFERYLEFAEGEDGTGVTREIRVGPPRPTVEEDGAAEHGVFLTGDQFERIIGGPLQELFELKHQIGELPEGAHPDEIKPRGGTWLGERTNWETEITQLRQVVSDLTKRNEELLTKSAGEGVAQLPADLREKLIAIKGVGERLADEILEVLQQH